MAGKIVQYLRAYFQEQQEPDCAHSRSRIKLLTASYSDTDTDVAKCTSEEKLYEGRGYFVSAHGNNKGAKLFIIQKAA